MIAPASLPPLYAGWLDELLAGPIPAEKNATCDDCAMLVADSAANARDDQGFNPDTKCCTFLPELWNFLVGRILLDDHDDAARGRATVEARLDRGLGVTPLGFARTRPFNLTYSTGGIAVFGQSRSLRCPHYLHDEGGKCGVWRHRESTCATWFCKYVRGAVGQNFWLHTHQLLQTVEQTLAGWALLELGLDADVLARLYEPHRDPRPTKITGRDLDGAPDPQEYARVWGRWRGRERELYIECARLVSPLTWANVVRLGGAQVDVCARLVQHAYARLMSEAVPERPATALVQISPRAGGRVRLATYSGSDWLDVPSVVATILPYFDGRPAAETIELVRRNEGVSIDPSLVRKLADFGVLRDEPTVSPS